MVYQIILITKIRKMLPCVGGFPGTCNLHLMSTDYLTMFSVHKIVPVPQTHLTTCPVGLRQCIAAVVGNVYSIRQQKFKLSYYNFLLC